MQALTQVDQLIITRVLEAGGLTCTTISKLADDIPAGNDWVRTRVHRLERLGCLCVKLTGVRGRQGRTLRLCCRCLIASVGFDTVDASCAQVRSLTPAEG